jgi:hypothetical protein
MGYESKGLDIKMDKKYGLHVLGVRFLRVMGYKD